MTVTWLPTVSVIGGIFGGFGRAVVSGSPSRASTTTPSAAAMAGLS